MFFFPRELLCGIHTEGGVGSDGDMEPSPVDPVEFILRGVEIDGIRAEGQEQCKKELRHTGLQPEYGKGCMANESFFYEEEKGAKGIYSDLLGIRHIA
jgi:hypothetical protein